MGGSITASYSAYWRDFWATRAFPIMWISSFLIFCIYGILRADKTGLSILEAIKILAAIICVFVATSAWERVRSPADDFGMFVFVVVVALIVPCFCSAILGRLVGGSMSKVSRLKSH
jgi:hypothetical protein